MQLHPIFVLSTFVLGINAAPTKQYCGTQSTSLCANQTKAQAPCYPIDQNDENNMECNYVEYQSWPNVTNWSQCKEACLNTTDCQSISYTLQPPNEFQGPATTCYLFFKSVSKYTQSCSAANAQPLNIYYDVGCPTPAKNTTGKVPAHPSNDIVNGTCDGSLEWNQNQAQWIADGFEAAPSNLTQQQCHNHCHSTAGCKSYFWIDEVEASVRPRYSTQTSSYPSQSSTGYSPAQCLLLSQPVSEYVTSTVAFSENFFFDKNCPQAVGV